MNAYNPALREEHHNLTLSIIGTAIRVRQDLPHRVRATRTVVSLREGRSGESTIDPAVRPRAARTQ